MNETDLRPEMLRPYDPRHVAQPPPDVGVCDGPVFTVCVNTKWWAHCSGMIGRLLYRDAWVGTESEIDDAIQSIYTILDVGEPTMGCGCGCSGSGLPSRYTSDGVFQVSYDGGTTWVDAPNQDPRNNVTQLPPNSTGVLDDDKCKAANSAVAFLQEMQADTLAKRQSQATIAAIAEAVIAFLVVVGIIATGGALAVLGGAIAAIAASSDAGTFEAAFTNSVWADLLCYIYCALDDNLAISEAQWQQISSQIKTAHSGIAGDYLGKTIDMMGAGGLTNATRLGLNAGLSCSGCECVQECAPDIWQIFNGTENYGEIVEVGADYIVCDLYSAPSTVGEYFLRLKTITVNSCCKVSGYEIVSGGTINISRYQLCGVTQDGTTSHDLQTSTGSGEDQINLIAIGSTGPCRVKIYFV